jgi:hypothetical protein
MNCFGKGWAGKAGSGSMWLKTFIVLASLVILPAQFTSPAGACHPKIDVQSAILTIDGLIQGCDGRFEVRFDLAALKSLPARDIKTRNPWDKGLVHYRGVLLRDLADDVGANGSVLTITALDDYRADLPIADIRRHDILLAYERNGATMSVRERGPLFVVFPFTTQPELETEARYAQSVWQVSRITVK